MLVVADIVEAIRGVRPTWDGGAVRGAVVDSRQASEGCLFVALRGENANGHDFVADAFAKGAHYALVDEDMPAMLPVLDLRPGKDIPEEPFEQVPYCIRVENSLEGLQKAARHWRRKLSLRVIGVTGSVGKSTTKEVVAQVLSQRYRTLKNPGNLNNEIGLPMTLLSATEEHQRAVLEMGFYVPGEIAFLCDIALPYVGVVTNIGTVHASRAGSKEVIAQGKAELVQALPPAPEGVAILNFDDDHVKRMADQTQARVFFYGLQPGAHLWADQVESLGLDGIRLRLHYQDEALHLRVPLLGRHSAHTVLRAAAVGLVEGLSWQDIVAGLLSGKAQLRLVTTRAKTGALILDDTYNASPESTLAALNLLDEISGRKVAVLGDMLELGPYEASGHEMVGVRAAQVVDELITVGERARMIAAAARRAGLREECIVELEDTQAAIAFLNGRFGEEDVVLIKGSHGMRMDQIVSALEAER